MTTRDQLLHIAFGHSAALSLKQALAQLGRQERVICEPDDLGYGPISSHSAALRAEFFFEGLGYEDDPTFIDEIDAFWTEATTSTATAVAWLSRRCVREYAGFLEFVSRRNEPLLVVDVAKVQLTGRDGIAAPDISMSMGYVSPEMMIENKLLERATPISDAELERERARWTKLKDENADLRVLDATGLVSAPITFFDKLITSFVTDDWQRCAKVIAKALVRSSTDFTQTGDLFLWSRLRSLAEEGLVDGRGEMVVMGESSVRKSGGTANKD
jgi:hypothetical protein